MERKHRFLSAVVILMLTGIFCMGFASANQFSDEQSIDNERGELTTEEFTAAVEFLKSKEKVIEKRGNVPEFKDAQHRRAWYNFLDNFTSDNFGSVEPCLYPNGSIIGFGYDIEGYVRVSIVKGCPSEKLTSTMDEMYTMLDEQAKKVGIDQIPVKFRSVDPDGLVLDDADDRFRPVIGGVQMQVVSGGSTGTATIGWAARNAAGTLGYVIAGHCSDGVGETIYQPTVGASNAIGTVAADTNWPNVDTYADAAWVPYSNVAAVFYSQDYQFPVDGYYNNAGVGLSVSKSGVTTGTTSGATIADDVVYDNNTKKYLNHQYFVSYTASGGDSGAPVYHIEPDHDRIITGIHSGNVCGVPYFSPVSGVQSELGVLPLTV